MIVDGYKCFTAGKVCALRRLGGAISQTLALYVEKRRWCRRSVGNNNSVWFKFFAALLWVVDKFVATSPCTNSVGLELDLVLFF